MYIFLDLIPTSDLGRFADGASTGYDILHYETNITVAIVTLYHSLCPVIFGLLATNQHREVVLDTYTLQQNVVKYSFLITFMHFFMFFCYY